MTQSVEREEGMMAALRAVRDFGDAHDRMSSGIRHGMHMNATDLLALRFLIIREEAGRTASPAEIARHLRISTASTVKLVDRLTTSGHVRRVPHPTDRRARVIELTQVARKDFSRFFGEKLRAIRASFEDFSDEELDATARVLARVGEIIGEETN